MPLSHLPSSGARKLSGRGRGGGAPGPGGSRGVGTAGRTDRRHRDPARPGAPRAPRPPRRDDEGCARTPGRRQTGAPGPAPARARTGRRSGPPPVRRPGRPEIQRQRLAAVSNRQQQLLRAPGEVAEIGRAAGDPGQIELLQASLDVPLHANQLQFGIMHTGMVDQGIAANMRHENSSLASSLQAGRRMGPLRLGRFRTRDRERRAHGRHA